MDTTVSPPLKMPTTWIFIGCGSTKTFRCRSSKRINRSSGNAAVGSVATKLSGAFCQSTVALFKIRYAVPLQGLRPKMSTGAMCYIASGAIGGSKLKPSLISKLANRFYV